MENLEKILYIELLLSELLTAENLKEIRLFQDFFCCGKNCMEIEGKYWRNFLESGIIFSIFTGF